MKRIQLANYKATHFGYSVTGKVATITLNRPERKNPLTFDSYGELRDLFREMVYATDIKAIGKKVGLADRFADLDGSGIVDQADVTIATNNKGKRLP